MAKKITARKQRQDQATPRRGWTRLDDDRAATFQFGKKLKSFRVQRGLTLNEASEATGIPAASLSRIENNKMAPTFGVLVRIMHAFNINWTEVVSGSGSAKPTKEISYSQGKEALRISAKSGTYVFPHGDSSDFSFTPLFLEVSATEPEEFGGLVGHFGVEFCYVLDGVLKLHFEGKKPQLIKAGGSIIFESRIPHAYTKSGEKTVRLLIVGSGLPKGGFDISRARVSSAGKKPSSSPARKRSL